MSESDSLDVVRALLQARRTVLADVDWGSGPPTERLLVRSDVPGTFQLFELADGLRQLTSLPEPVATAEYVPGTRLAVLAIDAGGDECHQLYLLDLDQATSSPVASLDSLRAITADPRFVHNSAGISPDGTLLAYLSNRGNAVDFDLWLCDLASGEHRLLRADGAYLQPGAGFSPDGRWVSILRPGTRSLDVEMLLVDIHSGEMTEPLPHPNDAAEVGPPAWTGPSSFCVSSSIGRDLPAIVQYDLATGLSTALAGTGTRFGAEVVTSQDGSTAVVIENRNGANSMYAVNPGTGAVGPEIDLSEPGVTNFFLFAPPLLSPDGSRLFYTLTTPRQPGDVYSCELATGAITRLTHSPTEIGTDRLAGPELDEVVSFDGERIPLFIYRPASDQPRPPVVVLVHGGPEGQAMRLFDPVVQALVAAGYGVVVPNVRGSTGYGKRYASLDDTINRLDSVRDLAAIHGQLHDLGFDPDCAVLWGGSYGGYMVLAGLAFQPELWAAGVDIVGISNLVTFLENTSDYRRAFRELEYGSLAHDREFLSQASPLTHVASIQAPLFVIHGRNDPRVPVSEAQQLVDSLQARGVTCELVIYEDEGHGLARLGNRLDAFPRAIAFVNQVRAQTR
jgi:acetyl esterase/lipase